MIIKGRPEKNINTNDLNLTNKICLKNFWSNRINAFFNNTIGSNLSLFIIFITKNILILN